MRVVAVNSSGYAFPLYGGCSSTLDSQALDEKYNERDHLLLPPAGITGGPGIEGVETVTLHVKVYIEYVTSGRASRTHAQY